MTNYSIEEADLADEKINYMYVGLTFDEMKVRETGI